MKDLFDDLAEQYMASRGNRAQLAAIFRKGIHAEIQQAAEQINAHASRLNDAVNLATVRQVRFLTESVIALSEKIS